MNKSASAPSPVIKRFRNGFSYLFLFLGAAIMLIPFLWMISTSLKTEQYFLTLPPQFIPSHPTLDSYRRLAELYPIGRMIFNSVVVAVCSTLGQLITCSMAAYVFARMKFRGRDALFFIYLATMMIPFQVTITPLFILMRIFGWVNTYQGIILPGVFSAVNTFVLRQAFLAIPKDYEESAILDGANPLQVFWNILLPLAKPGLATVTVLGFMNSWNGFLWPLMVTRDRTLMTLPVGLASLQGQYVTEWNLVMAGSVITILPMVLVYLFAQKYIIQGFVGSGLKG
jgi:multiple sugar transport system permease protein